MIPLDLNKAKDFLAKNQIRNCEIKQVAGDASFRSYYRIFNADKTFILMFAPPKYEDIRLFEKIAHFLLNSNFSAPKILARSEESGFLLLEDFGDDTYGRILKKSQNQEYKLYEKAIDVLLNLHEIKNFPNDILPYNNAVLFREVMLFVDWYLLLKGKKMSINEISEFKHLWFGLFDLLDKENHVLVLRDYHADNLMFLPNRDGFQSVGLLDFQDALIGSIAYDLVSLLEDARRDIDCENQEKLFNYYLKRSKTDIEKFQQDYAILSLQRNIKIIGIFSRLSIRDKKHHYLELLPRVLAFVEKRLNSENAILKDIKVLLKNFL